MNYKIFVASDVGLVRTNNEDAVAAGGLDDVRAASWQSEQRDQCWVAVADGIGGSPAGELASALTIRVFASIVDRLSSDDEILSSIAAIDEVLTSTAAEYPGTRGMGTTLAATLVRNNACISVNLGDSRIYLHRRSKLVQLSTDHAHANYLTGYLGGQAPTEERVAISRHDLVGGDALVVCTDGLTNMVNDDQIAAILTENLDNPAQLLMRAALAAGGVDNVTVAVIRCEQELDDER